MIDDIKRRWRDVIKVHPAAHEMRRMPPDELHELGKDAYSGGSRPPIPE
jgi:hypothetical protein